jgi:hypothetical protein
MTFQPEGARATPDAGGHPTLTPNEARPAWSEVVEARARMHQGGWRIVPVCEARKAPMFAGWPAYGYDPDQPEPPVPRTRTRQGSPTRAPHRGSGVITEGVIALDLDIDDPPMAARARATFELTAGEPCPIVRYRKGSARRLLLYRAGAGFPPASLSAGADASGKIEIFANHPGRLVFVLGRHPSGSLLQYEGDSPPDWPVRELPALSASQARGAYLAALDAVGISVGAGESPQLTAGRRGSVRCQPTESAAVRALGEEIARLMTGESVHRASNAAADLLAFQIGLDAAQIGQVLAALACAGRSINPGDTARYRELADKADSRGAWYAEAAAQPPANSANARFWAEARERQFRRAWAQLAEDLKQDFVAAVRIKRTLGDV